MNIITCLGLKLGVSDSIWPTLQHTINSGHPLVVRGGKMLHMPMILRCMKCMPAQIQNQISTIGRKWFGENKPNPNPNPNPNPMIMINIQVFYENYNNYYYCSKCGVWVWLQHAGRSSYTCYIRVAYSSKLLLIIHCCTQ